MLHVSIVKRALGKNVLTEILRFFFYLCSKVADFLHVTQHYLEDKCSRIFLAGLFFISKN